jgi:NhaP-type Na+/H+ or K+/H+ antiporter
VILAFGLVLGIAALLSQRANNTVLSTSVMFLAAGFLIGPGGLSLVPVKVGDEVIQGFAEVALFTILFVDGTHLPVKELSAAWRLPGRALLWGMPLTMGVIALAGHVLLSMNWAQALLVGAILSPTDPVFVAAILEHEAVPLKLRRLLSVESGLNDGLALPAVVIFLAVAGNSEVRPLRILLAAAAGALLGVVIPASFVWLERSRFFAATRSYRPLVGLAVGTVLLGLTRLSGTNEFLAAYAGGITLATLGQEFASAIRDVFAPIAEALKLATLLLFGATLSVQGLLAPGMPGLLFAIAALLAARPLALFFALRGSGLTRKEWLAAAWFGPKGFASLLYALLMLHSAVPGRVALFQAVALVIVLSIIAHSSTDVAVARVFCEEEGAPRARG